jgi:hypothetical protein
MDHNSPVSARLCGAIVAVAFAPWLVCASTMAQELLHEANADRGEEPSLAVVLQRAGAYVTEFQQRLSGIVAEEHYVQDATSFNNRRRTCGPHPDPTGLSCGSIMALPIRTALKSDLLLVRVPGATRWAEFRDVFEADGVRVRDRAERLTQLFLGRDPVSAREQLGRILDASARFNIGEIERNINTPMFALQFLEASNQKRFKFSRSRNGKPDTFARPETPGDAFRTSTEVWVVDYEETAPQTLVRTDDRRDFPMRGRFWIEPASGRVMMSEIVARNKTVDATIDVSYQSEPVVGMFVPVEMREDYKNRSGWHITANATYGRFRQFTVNVDETFLIKK